MANKPTSADEEMLAMNEALTLGALRQHELTEAANSANVQLRAEIAERKQAEEVLRQSEERFRSLVSVITDVPWVTDANGAFITPQPEWEGYTGQTWEEHRNFGWAKAIHPEDREQVKEIWQRARESHILYQSEGRLWHAPTQQWRCFKAKATPLLNPDGTVREWVGTCTDCEDQKRAEQERDRLLRSEREARKQADEANRIKDEFLAIVSHELRTPLNAILGWAHMLKRGTLDEDTSTRGLETIVRNATAQNQLISDLLDVSRIISGQLRCEMAAVDLVPVIEAAVDSVRPAADAKLVELRLTLDPAAGMVSGDAVRLQQIVSNLLANAVKFTSRTGRVDVQLKRQDTSVVIIVTDSGEGISPEFLPYIFDRFRQAEGTASRQHGGLGLGLAIVRHLVELHGGTVRAFSEGIGKGATFTVTFPLIAVTRDVDLVMRKEGATAEQSALRNTQSEILAGMRVLVVDDEPDARELLTIVLKQSGADVEARATVREALEVLNQWKPNVLVSDIGMPREDGYELIRKMRALGTEQGGTIPAIALTGYASDEDAARARVAGYQLHMPKPVSPGELVAKVASLARKARHV